jgi:hypothetical protein
MAEKLIPPDLERCQAERLEGSFMTFGPMERIRCKNTAVWVAKEKRPPEKGMPCGSMSLCDKCKEKLIEQKGKNYCTFTKIKRATSVTAFVCKNERGYWNVTDEHWRTEMKLNIANATLFLTKSEAQEAMVQMGRKGDFIIVPIKIEEIKVK